jgi:hypothetical protein
MNESPASLTAMSRFSHISSAHGYVEFDSKVSLLLTVNSHYQSHLQMHSHLAASMYRRQKGQPFPSRAGRSSPKHLPSQHRLATVLSSDDHKPELVVRGHEQFKKCTTRCSSKSRLVVFVEFLHDGLNLP